jgi:hypothetical protein
LAGTPSSRGASFREIGLGLLYPCLHLGMMKPELIPGHQVRGDELPRSSLRSFEEHEVTGPHTEV